MGGVLDPVTRLAVLEAITDGALRELELEQVFDVLLPRVRELFAVDTATVLLTDAGGRQLVARAASGLEAEVFQGVRVPVGVGFAGRVAQQRKPVRIDRVDESTVVNPLLWTRGLRVLLGVPMVTQGDLVGVLHVGRTAPREFDDEEVVLLQLVADRLAMAAHAHRSRVERTAAAMLQDSLLPETLPATAEWHLAARYVPGAHSPVGGDWYDVFRLPGDRLGLVIGDVAGSGLAAAIVMGRLRSALRAYALEFTDPAEVLGRLDRKASHFEGYAMATIAYGVIDTPAHRLELALAGHPPPVLAVPDGRSVLVDAPVGPPVGYGLAVTGRRSVGVDLPPGALVALYTDGLVERRDVDLDMRLERLRAVTRAEPPETACVRIMAALVGDTPAADDVALLAVRRAMTAT
ncbi:GAF domain-containing SpoIIE family protein phosphatase [Actinosynnema sp. NPDC023587]|uniref:PP2C family protein-serine/threonine phosphatase n=1 Tax=Actinosynnema sp. NPDC023587 TaxID=3154695 RepID=UPI0033EC1660